MTLTLTQLIDDTLNRVLLGTYRQHANLLDLPLTDVATAMTLKYGMTGLGEGSYVEVEQEMMYVPPGGVNVAAKTLTLIRAIRGTTAVAHPANLPVYINPRFPRNSLLEAMRSEALSWPNSMFQVMVNDTSTHGNTDVDIDALFTGKTVHRVVKVWRLKTGSDGGRWIRVRGWRFERDIDGPNTGKLFLPMLGTASLRIMVAIPFNLLDQVWTESMTTDALGMTDGMAEVLMYGSAWRLVTGREARRLFTEVESESRNVQEVPPGTNVALGKQLKAVRDARLGEEIMRLRSNYGVRGT